MSPDHLGALWQARPSSHVLREALNKLSTEEKHVSPLLMAVTFRCGHRRNESAGKFMERSYRTWLAGRRRENRVCFSPQWRSQGEMEGEQYGLFTACDCA